MMHYFAFSIISRQSLATAKCFNFFQLLAILANLLYE